MDTEKGNTAPMGGRRKGVKAPPMTDDEIRAMLRARFPHVEPNEPTVIEVDDETWRALNRGRPREEWRIEAYERVHALHVQGMTVNRACHTIFPDYKQRNRTMDAFIAGYWTHRRETAKDQFCCAILACDFDAAVEAYKTLTAYTKRKLNII